MAKLSTSELKGILSSARSAALGSDSASTLSEERMKASDYYNGDMSADMPAADGRSSAVSMDVQETVEGLMPALMEIFCGGDEVVKFEPVGPEDVEAADQETDYVNHVFLQKNDGFLILYSFIKDALLQKNGFAKVFHESTEEDEKETYFDLPDDQFAMIAAAAQSGEVEITEHTAHEMEGYQPDPANPQPAPQLHDVTVVTTKKYECDRVESVPPEEFGFARNTRKLKTANYCYHEVTRPQNELIDEGFDEAQIKKLPTFALIGNNEAQARDTVDENQQGADDANSATRSIRVTEHYIRMDYERNGKTSLYRVTTGGEQSEVLKRDGKPDIEPVDYIPFATMTPIVVPHRLIGRSVADLVMDIQRIKTALLRGSLDNIYAVLNPRVEVSESHASTNTLDDLLVSRHGGFIRTKTPGGINWQVVPSIAADIFPALEYFDTQKETRTGITRQGQGIDAKALQNQSATAVNQSFTMAQARMRLIARILAETGIKDLFSLLHATIRKHGSEKQTVRLRNKWVQVDPRDWKARNDMTIHVGLGAGGKAEQLAETQILMDAQEKGMHAGLVSKNNLYSTAKRLTRVLGEKDADAFFTDPAKATQAQGDPAQQQQAPDPNAQPIQPPPDPKVQGLQMKAQIDQQALAQKAEIEKLQAQADIATQDRKTQAEIALAEKKFELDRELKMLDAQLKVREHQDNMAMQENKAQLDERVATRKMKMDANSSKVGPGQSINDEGDVGVNPELAQLLSAVLQSHSETQKAVSAPRKTMVVRGPDGKVSHAVSVVDDNHQ